MPRSLDAPLGKWFKTYCDQIALLRKRGMLIESDLEACWLLERVKLLSSFGILVFMAQTVSTWKTR